jgi:hypothetical protein
MCCRRCYYQTAEWKQTHLNCSSFDDRIRSTAHDHCALRLLCVAGTKTCECGSWSSTYVSQKPGRAGGYNKEYDADFIFEHDQLGRRLRWSESMDEFRRTFGQHCTAPLSHRTGATGRLKTYGNAPGPFWKRTLISALVD